MSFRTNSIDKRLGIQRDRERVPSKRDFDLNWVPFQWQKHLQGSSHFQDEICLDFHMVELPLKLLLQEPSLSLLERMPRLEKCIILVAAERKCS